MSLWFPRPWAERQNALEGVKLNPSKKIDEKKLRAAMARNEKRFACFKTPVTAETLLRLVP